MTDRRCNRICWDAQGKRCKCDRDHFLRLAIAFPQHAAALEAWKEGDLIKWEEDKPI